MDQEIVSATEALLLRLIASMKRTEISIDAKLAKEVLRGDFENRAALVTALEQVRVPLREELIKQARASFELYNKEIEKCKTALSTTTDELATLLEESIGFLQTNMNMTVKEIDEVAAKNVSEDEAKKIVEEILNRSEARTKEARKVAEEKKDALMKKSEEVLPILVRAEKELNNALNILIQKYLVACQEKSLPVFEEFVV